jgi:hypothetical protein
MRPLQALVCSAVLAPLARAALLTPWLQQPATGCDMRGHNGRCSFGRVIVVALLAVMLAACGDDDDKSDSQAAANPSGNPAPTPPPLPPPPSSSGTATLEWIPPVTTTTGATLTNLVGYRIYYGTDVSKLVQKVDITNPGIATYVIEGLKPATYYFAVTAIDARGAESARSNAGRKEII